MKFLALLVVILIQGCAVPVKHVTESHNEPLQKSLVEPTGKAVIKGSAFARKGSGETVTCAGAEVGLFGVTPYTSERMKLLYNSEVKGANPVSVSYLYGAPVVTNGLVNLDKPPAAMRTVRCDVQGFFKFDNVKTGDYFVTTYVYWRATPNLGLGAQLMERVKIINDEIVELVLAP